MSLISENGNCPESLGPWVELIAYIASGPGCRTDFATGAGFDVYRGKKAIGEVLSVNKAHDRPGAVVLTLGPPCFDRDLAHHFYAEARHLVQITWLQHNYARTMAEISAFEKELVVSSIEVAFDEDSDGNQSALMHVSPGDYVVFTGCVRTMQINGERTIPYASQFVICKK